MAGAAAAPANFHGTAPSNAPRSQEPGRALPGAEPVSIVRALLLSIAGAIAAFWSALLVLEGASLPWVGLSESTRIAAFASPELRMAQSESLTALRPVPVTGAAGDEKSAQRAHGPYPLRAAFEASTEPVARSAWVPPITRRQPQERSAFPTVEAAAVTSSESRPKASPRRPLPDLETSTRSALGGPRPAAQEPSTAPIVEPNHSGTVPLGP
jgi:hypothetical protein